MSLSDGGQPFLTFHTAWRRTDLFIVRLSFVDSEPPFVKLEAFICLFIGLYLCMSRHVVVDFEAKPLMLI